VIDGEILIGLGGIKYLGEKSLVKILEQRGDLTEDNIKQRTGVNKRMVEYLKKAGAFEYEPTMEEEKEALGFNVNRRFTDVYWWSDLMPELGEIIDVHKITTKKGDPMAFIKVEFRDDIKSITVFPDYWSSLKEHMKVGNIGIFKADRRGVLVKSTPIDVSRFKVSVKKPEEFISFCPSNGGEENIFYEGYGISSVKMNEELLRFIYDEFGIQKLTI
jgi:DNA polymerase III alpha subunit